MLRDGSAVGRIELQAAVPDGTKNASRFAGEIAAVVRRVDPHGTVDLPLPEFQAVVHVVEAISTFSPGSASVRRSPMDWPAAGDD